MGELHNDMTTNNIFYVVLILVCVEVSVGALDECGYEVEIVEVLILVCVEVSVGDDTLIMLDALMRKS